MSATTPDTKLDPKHSSRALLDGPIAPPPVPT